MEDALEELINAEPFHPFKIIMTSGHEYTGLGSHADSSRTK